MDTEAQRTWWQELGAISRGLMFIDGSIATPGSLQESERPQPASIRSPSRDEPGKPQPASLGRKARWLLDSLILLGGRPETVRHNDDIDEPFPALHRRRQVRGRRAPRRRAVRTAPAQNCATC